MSRSVPAPQAVEDARGLELVARAVVEALRAGRHVTPRPGDADEFYDYRCAGPGDPASRIDWRATARREEPVVRRRRRHAPMTLAVVIDGSSSMGFRAFEPSPGTPSKLDDARRIAAALVAASLAQGDSAIVIPSRTDGPRPLTFTGRRGLASACEGLVRLTPAGDDGLSVALSRVARDISAADLVIGIGDALEPLEPLAEALALLTRRRSAPRDVMLVQTLAADELAPAPVGSMLADPESDARAVIEDAAGAQRAAGMVVAHIERVREIVQRLGGRHEVHRAGADVARTLRRLLARGGRNHGV